MSNFFSLLNSTYSNEHIENTINKEAHIPKIIMNHVGLKISMSSNKTPNTKLNIEPIYDENIILLCYGEIFNSQELFHFMNIKQNTPYNYEIIIHLYRRYGMEHTLRMIDGYFSFLLLDNNIESENFKLYIARDSYGIKPLYILHPIQRTNINSTIYRDESIIGFSTDKHLLFELYKNLNSDYFSKKIENKYYYELKPFLPGTYSSYILSSKILSSWVIKKENIKFHMHGYNSIMYSLSSQYNNKNIVKNIQLNLIHSIEKRCNLYGPNQYACFLNGKIQNNILAGIINQFHLFNNYPILKTYSIVIKDSIELENARKTAEYLKTEHTEYNITNDFFLKEFIESNMDLECYNEFNIDNTKYTDLIHQLLIGRYIKNKEIKYIFNGNGANEIFGSSEYMIEPIQYDLNVRNSIEKIFLNDLFISDISFYYNGFIPCSPFLDRSFVEYYLSIPPQIRFEISKINVDYFENEFEKKKVIKETDRQIIKERLKEIDKYFLRLAFSGKYYKNIENNPLLPVDIIWS